MRNLPLNLNADDLKKQLAEFSKIEGLSLTNAKIMRSKDRKDESGSLRSMGFGFVDVNTHENALKLLRATNNNPEIFGENRRPIVEFSVENTKALKILDLKKQKIEEMKTAREQGETEGMNEQQKEDFDANKHRSYKEKANEKRMKRRLRYARKRKEKRETKQAEGSDDDDLFSDKAPAPKQPKQDKTQKPKQPKNPKPAEMTKQPVETKSEKKAPKPEKSPRKRPVNNNEPAVKNLENEDENLNKRSRKAQTISTQKEESKFNSLVEQYKNKLNSSTNTPAKKKKNIERERWFNE